MSSGRKTGMFVLDFAFAFVRFWGFWNRNWGNWRVLAVLDGLEFLDTDDAGPGPRPQDYHRTHRTLKRTREHFRFRMVRMAYSRLDVSRVSEGM